MSKTQYKSKKQSKTKPSNNIRSQYSPSFAQTLSKHSLWSTLLLSLLLSCIYLSFTVVAKLDYSYHFWYSTLGIDEAIDTYGPQNRYKSDFEKTNTEERVRLFSEIAKSVHNNGEGLKDITYHLPDNTPIDKMLRPAEVKHLEDVATLINIVNKVGISCLVISIALITIITLFKYYSPAISRYFTFAALGLIATTAIILLLGPRKVFYQLHVWVFPKDNEWFFYYQDSLMSTSMKAPILFGGIAVEIAVLAIILYGMCLKGLHTLNTHLKTTAS